MCYSGMCGLRLGRTRSCGDFALFTFPLFSRVNLNFDNSALSRGHREECCIDNTPLDQNSSPVLDFAMASMRARIAATGNMQHHTRAVGLTLGLVLSLLLGLGLYEWRRRRQSHAVSSTAKSAPKVSRLSPRHSTRLASLASYGATD